MEETSTTSEEALPDFTTATFERWIWWRMRKGILPCGDLDGNYFDGDESDEELASMNYLYIALNSTDFNVFRAYSDEWKDYNENYIDYDDTMPGFIEDMDQEQFDAALTLFKEALEHNLGRLGKPLLYAIMELDLQKEFVGERTAAVMKSIFAYIKHVRSLKIQPFAEDVSGRSLESVNLAMRGVVFDSLEEIEITLPCNQYRDGVEFPFWPDALALSTENMPRLNSFKIDCGGAGYLTSPVPIHSTSLRKYSIDGCYECKISTNEMYEALSGTLRGCPNLEELHVFDCSMVGGPADGDSLQPNASDEAVTALCEAIGDSTSLLRLDFDAPRSKVFGVELAKAIIKLCRHKGRNLLTRGWDIREECEGYGDDPVDPVDTTLTILYSILREDPLLCTRVKDADDALTRKKQAT